MRAIPCSPSPSASPYCKINWEKIQKVGRYAYHVVKALCDLDSRPTFVRGTLPNREEAQLIKQSIQAALGHDEVVLNDQLRKQGLREVAKLDKLLEKENFEKKDRSVIQKAMIWLFRVQASQIKWKAK